MNKIGKAIIGTLAGAALMLAPAQSIIFGARNAYMARASETYLSNEKGEEKVYDLQEVLTPVWKGDICYQESVLPVAKTGGDVVIPLLYPATEVISVQSATLKKTFTEGVDYGVKDGELVVYRQGDIPIMSSMEFNPMEGQFPSKDGGYLCFSEGAYFHTRQIVVTYKHKAKYNGYVPESKANLLPNLTAKIAAGEGLDMFVLGDSISVGANSSGFADINVSPYLPIYPQLFADGLKEKYGLAHVNVYNHSVGGKTSAWGVSEVDGALALHEKVDLAILAFGMNDGGLSPAAFNSNLSVMINAVQTKFPQADILLVATMLPNPKSYVYQNQALFAENMIAELETQGVAVVNMTAVHESLLVYKAYADMTGNNINHPNDYLARVYAQSLLATVEKSDEKPDDAGEKNGCGGVADGVCAPIAAALGLVTCKKLSKKSKENLDE